MNPLDMVARGWHLFPVEPNGKKPLVPWRDQSTREAATIEAWSRTYPECNWGVDCGKSGLAVVDEDNKGKANGAATLMMLELDGQVLPPTLTVDTPSGGKHYYFVGGATTSASKLGAGVDTRGEGGYVVSPGSSIDGVPYAITQDQQIAPVPQWVVDVVGRPTERTERVESPAVELDQAGNILRAIDYLKRATPSVEGDGGDENAYRVACKVRDLGVSADVAFDLMCRDEWNDRCDPPWEPQELKTKIDNAYQYAQNQAGVNTPEAVFGAVPITSGRDRWPAEVWPTDLSDFNPEPPARDWIVEDWIPKGATVLFTGAGGAGKSLVGLQAAASIGFNTPWLGCGIDTPVETLYVSCEDNLHELELRWQQARRLPEYAMIQWQELTRRVRFWAREGCDNRIATMDKKTNSLTKSHFYDVLEQGISEMSDGHKLIFLDTAADTFEGNENDNGQVSQFIKRIIAELKVKYDCTIVIIHHTTKNGEAAYRGASAWSFACRGAMVLGPHPDEELDGAGFLALVRHKSNYAKQGEYITVRWENGAYVCVDNAGEIFQEVEDRNRDLVMAAIIENADAGHPLGLRANSSNPIEALVIRDVEGKVMDVKMKKRLVQALVREGVVENRTGQKHSNGLRPV